MNTEGYSHDPVVTTVLHEPTHDAGRHEEGQQPEQHDHATEVAHAWAHFHENWRFFAGFLTIVVLTVLAWSINFGPWWNFFFVLLTAAMRCSLIAYFMATLFKSFGFVTKTFVFCAIFLAGMIWLSLWDSTIKAGYVGDPIRLPGQYDTPPTETSSHVP